MSGKYEFFIRHGSDDTLHGPYSDTIAVENAVMSAFENGSRYATIYELKLVGAKRREVAAVAEEV